MHISIKKELSYRDSSFKYAKVLDFPYIFKRIEAEFGKEIADSDRTKGFYEVKDDGRVEYRSLPCTLINDVNFAKRLENALDNL